MGERFEPLQAADGTTLFVRRWPVDAPWAEVLIVHGLGEHSGRYQHVAGFLNARGLDVFAYDHRGHGRSAGARMHLDDVEFLRDDLQAVIERDVLPEGGPWVLYGHSLGGLVVAGYLAQERPQPDAAILSAPALDADVPGYLRAAAAILGRVAPKLKVTTSIRGDQLSRDPAVGEAYFADPLVETKATTGLGLALFTDQARVRARLGKIRVPVLVVHGTEDELVPPRASAPLAGVPGVERRLYPGLRHELHNEPEGEEVLGEIVDWLRAALQSE